MKTILYQVKGTVILKIWWQILLVTMYTTGVLCLVKYWLEWDPDSNSDVKNQRENLVQIFGLFTGFLLVFRTNTAYDRYWEGRKLWSAMICNIRTLTRLIWTMIAVKEDEANAANKAIVEKVSIINLLIAFVYATRNYLRDEHSYDGKDLKPFLKHVPKIFQSQSNSRLAKRILDSTEKKIPIEISHLIMSYITTIREDELVDDPITTTMNNALNSLVDSVASFEKILKTPIPLAYSVHLHHATCLYFLALPFPLYEVLDWYTIPVAALTAFAMLGILDIGWEIENPFGDDDNDLPLDDFCKVIHQETLDILEHPMPPADEWILTNTNFPLMPKSCLPANELTKMTEASIRDILSRYREPLVVRRAWEET